MEATRKKKASLAIASVALVAIIAIAGTFAYLQSSTEDVTNTFNTNSVTVDLKETGNRQYNIIPGTSEKKDPTVTVNATVPAYVFVEVTDTTGGAVEWALADGWKPLDDYSNVYYSEYKPGPDAENAFPVIKNDTVAYPASLTNEALAALNDPKLTFKAYAIQKDPFNSAVEAYRQMHADTVVTLGTGEGESGVEDVNAAIADAKGSVVVLIEDAQKANTRITVPDGKEVTLLLSDSASLINNADHAVVVEDGGTLTVKGGTVDATAHARAAVYNNGTVTLENVTLTRSAESGTSSSNNGGNSYYVVLNHGTMTLSNCTVEAKGAYSSLIENGWQDGKNNTTKAESTLTINGGTYTGGLNTVKNDDYGNLTINGGTFTNIAQHAVMNWNVAVINGGTFASDSHVIWNGYGDDVMDKGQLTINGGDFRYSGNSYGVYRHGGTVKINTGSALFANEQRICNGSYDVLS